MPPSELSRYRDPDKAKRIRDAILKIACRPYRIMEMCGGQTHAIMKFGIDQLLGDTVSFIHGPGCPVCVTPAAAVEQAIRIARQPQTILATYGDMLRVPGISASLAQARAEGADVRVIYASLDAVKLARENPALQVVFFAIGFETTAPANAAALIQADALKLTNFSVLCSQFCVPPALTFILERPNHKIDGFLAAGHVCAVMGTEEYRLISRRFQVPISVTGFEPVDLLLGVYQVIQALESSPCSVSNAYSRAVAENGNPEAKALIRQVYQPCDRDWRGIGVIPQSGWRLNKRYTAFDAAARFSLSYSAVPHNTACIAGEILQGIKAPPDCPAYSRACTPENPLGAPMVSGEGTCAAYYRYHGVNR